LRFKGDFLFEFDELDRAVEMYTTLEGIDQNQDLDDFDVQMETALFFYRFGETLRRLGRTDEALARYKGALKLNQSHLPSLEAVGPLFIANEQWDEAARTFKQILQLTGGHGDAAKLSGVYTSLGLVEYQQGHEAKALKRFNKALELQPNQINALQGYGRILFDKMDWNSLLTVYNNIIYHAQEPGDVVDAYLIKGFVLDVKLSLPDKAAQHFEKSLAFDPAQPVALLRLAELALRREAWAEALSLADRAKALPASVSVSAVTASLELTRATALSGRGDEAMTQEAINAAAAIEDGLGDALQAVLSGSVMTTMGLHDLLRERLQAQL
jgi:tetratricopeptide (TPR) repeat protein